MFGLPRASIQKLEKDKFGELTQKGQAVEFGTPGLEKQWI
jgi:hypothetical protein